MLHKKSILITGAAGTIGKALSFQAIHQNAEKIILLDNAETPLYNLEQEISLKFHALLDIEHVLMDVKDERSMEALFERFRPEIIFHAAAYKHVPVLEKNPITAVVNNVLGTKILADLSVKYHVGKFIFISTDKAINPSSIMGATKLIGEKYIVALSKCSISKTKFIINRFGNILESNGSVVPLFRKQIKLNKIVTVTDEKATRFFMSISQAIELIFESLKIGKGGEVFVFDMGAAKNIFNLAIETIKSEGYLPHEDVKIKFTGLRPGEKLHEKYLENNISLSKTEHPKIYKSKLNANFDLIKLNKMLETLFCLAKTNELKKMVTQMKVIVPEFKSINSTFEKLDTN